MTQVISPSNVSAQMALQCHTSSNPVGLGWGGLQTQLRGVGHLQRVAEAVLVPYTGDANLPRTFGVVQVIMQGLVMHRRKVQVVASGSPKQTI